MVNPLPLITTVPTDTWVKADWEDFLTFADDPPLVIQAGSNADSPNP